MNAKTNKMKAVVSALTALAFASACTMGPDYARPSLPVPPSYKEAGATTDVNWKAAQPSDAIPREAWWKVFADPDLDALEAQVDISNQNIAAAEARWRQAQALTQQARAALFPLVSAAASATRSQAPVGTVNVQNGTVGAGIRNNINVELNVSWEIDLWGRVRRTIEANEAGAQASLGDLEAAKLSAQADLATDYWLLRVQDAAVAYLRDTVDAYEKSLQLTRNQYAAGVVGRVDVVLAETQYNSTKAQLLDATIQRAQLEHAIALLIGKAPADFSLAPTSLHTSFPAIPPGLPSALLERRPDVAAAERRVTAANAQIGVAKAAYFPALTLSAGGGFQNSVLSNLFTLPNRYWSIGPALAQAVFDAGLRQAQAAQAIATYDESVATYREIVLTAFVDVEDNLAALRILEQEAVAQAAAVEAARESAAITNNQYKAGIVNYLSVAVAQAAELNNERTALTILGRRMTASVALIKALGGGWDASALQDGGASNGAGPTVTRP